MDLEKLKQTEDEILELLDKWPKWEQAIADRYFITWGSYLRPFAPAFFYLFSYGMVE